MSKKQVVIMIPPEHTVESEPFKELKVEKINEIDLDDELEEELRDLNDEQIDTIENKINEQDNEEIHNEEIQDKEMYEEIQ